MLRDKIQTEMIAALKNHEEEKLQTLRFILARIKNQEIEKKTELNDEETVAVLRKFAKELRESIESFAKAGRNELANASKKQLETVSSYLPPEMSEENLKKAVDEIVAKNAELYQKNPKALIGITMNELKGKAEPARILKLLKV